MIAKAIKRGSVLQLNSLSVTTGGTIRGKEIVVPGTTVKVIRALRPAYFQCEVLPHNPANGPIFLYAWASQLNENKP